MRAALLLGLSLSIGCGGGSAGTTATAAREPDPRVVEDVSVEATALLDEIARREEAFFAEYGSYSSSGETAASATAVDLDPPWQPVMLPRDGGGEPWGVPTQGWNELEFTTGLETVRVQLRVAAGPPGTSPPGGGPSDDFWYLAMARTSIAGVTHEWHRGSWDTAVRTVAPVP